MSRSMIPSQQKLAEKLTILNDRGIGMLTRIYNIKKMLGSSDNKPSFLTDKTLEPACKALLKKFPQYDPKASQLTVVNNMKNEIMKALSLYYYTFLDIMYFKDHVVDLLTTIDACQAFLDIRLNFDLTKMYLELVATYVSIMILVSKVDDRKTVIALFNVAHEFLQGKGDQVYPRLGQMFLDYDQPMKKLAEEFVPHSRILIPALLSLTQIHPEHNRTAEQLRQMQVLSILAEPSKMSSVPTTEVIQCEYLSMNTMERWIIFGGMLCYQGLTDPNMFALWKASLESGYILQLCRDEVLHIHSYVISFFESLRSQHGQNKRVTEVKEFQQHALSTSDSAKYLHPKPYDSPFYVVEPYQFEPMAKDYLHLQQHNVDRGESSSNSHLNDSSGIHRERRKFLRTTLRQLTLVFTEEPGLLGPKALYVFKALSMAQDEVHWVLRHVANPPSKRHNVRLPQEDFHDRQLPELLFYMEELRGLVKKYNQVMQRYYVQYLSNYDAVCLNSIIQSIAMVPEDESVILSSFYNTMISLSVKQVEDNELFDFRGFRLDWFRLQAYSSVSKAGLVLRDHQDLSKHMNTVVFHTKMVDYLDEMINECGDLSVYCFYTNLFEHQFKQCMEFPAQHRFSIIFPMICAHFMNATHELCPEERHSIGTTSVQYAHWFLREMSEEVNQVITAICEEQCVLSYKLLPKHSAALILAQVQKKKKKDKEKEKKELEKPGLESVRKNREVFTSSLMKTEVTAGEKYKRQTRSLTRQDKTTQHKALCCFVLASTVTSMFASYRMDKLHMALTELCYAINYCNIIQVWDHGFIPREFFVQHLEARFNKALVGMMMYNPETTEIAKPSELLNGVRAYMNVLQGLENYVHIDIARVFNNVLPQQTQSTDATGEKTITANYTNWYLEVLLRRATCNAGQIVYSPRQKAFVTVATTDGQQNFAAEEYADLTELRALAELIGPYGMKFLGERLMLSIASQVDELKKIVVSNKETLIQLRTSFDKPEMMRELSRKLQNVDIVLMRMTIIGVLLSFRALAQEALNDVLEDRIPFLMGSIRDIHHHMPDNRDSMPAALKQQVVNELASSAGQSCDVDPTLCNALRTLKSEHAEDEYTIACLLFVFVAVSIPKLARSEHSVFRAPLEGHMNNAHCLAKSVNALAGAVFSLYGPGDTETRLQEFLALASSSLLRLGSENEKEAVRNRESVYILLDLVSQ